jgi:hypothetical protein
MTMVAAAVVATLLLSTSGTPLLFIGVGHFPSGGSDLTSLQRRIDGIQRSLARVVWKREGLELRLLLDEALRHTAADPVVVRWSGDRLVADPALTAEIQPLWAALPARRPEIRSVVIVATERAVSYNRDTWVDSTGRCVVIRNGRDAPKELARAIRRSRADCLFAESFGAPGAGVENWLRGTSRGLSWDASGRGPDPFLLADAPPPAPAWFATGDGGIWLSGGGWRFRPIGREEMACLVGRAGRCGAATGVTAAGWPDEGVRWGYLDQRLPIAMLPRDLLREVGAARFEQIWSAEDPVASSYGRVTGVPMESWLGEWATRYAGPVDRDNGLSLAGWIGTFLWLSILTLLTFARLKQRTVS